jgi:hypothetical protein
MRLTAATTTDDALAWLLARARETWEVGPDDDLEDLLTPMARAMAELTAREIPEHVEPNAW